DSGLGTEPQDPQRGEFLRWLFYLSNTVHADLIRIFYPHRFVPAETIPVHYTMISTHLRGHMEILETAVQQNPTIFAPPSALTLYLGPLLRWSVLYPFEGERWLDLSKYPAIKELILSLETRASVNVAAAAEGLGEAPFSKPKLPNPPEGSAT
ncbi:MAG: glutathione S-transferase, partial [Pseudomonadota bacterium]